MSPLLKTEERKPSLRLNELRPDQWNIVKHPAKIKVIACGRRYGKSTVCGNVAVYSAAVLGHQIAWVVPVYANSRVVWKFIERACKELLHAGTVTRNKSEHIFLFANGGSISIFSADKPDSILGDNFDMIVIDEAARIAQSVYDETLLPMVADNDGSIWMISTPKGLNWFYSEFRRGLDEMERDGDKARMASFTRTTLSNTNPNIQRAYYEMGARLGENSRQFRQEWKAEFVSDGVLFTNVENRVYGPMSDVAPEYDPKKTRFIGYDTAKVGDASVITVVEQDDEVSRIIWIERWRCDYTEQLARLESLCKRLRPDAILVERTGNLSFVEQLERAGIENMSTFNTTNDSKVRIIDNLIAAFERGDIAIPKHDQLIAELLMFEQTKTPTGKVTYKAPPGGHDDHVMSLAFAYEIATEGATWEPVFV